ncbi:hypothetical protein CVT26_006730 [Gymnopilus dilepis]|uniref:Protein-S-isoprenylcysteine O-methyltransferase n=1 Tax=Gymnopilus dilepis TaxID=231916 RepID=A0A409W0N4_9AGAR|nr:hypothetical protein CVT26_006730 [Gymnopilus dilepis]
MSADVVLRIPLTLSVVCAVNVTLTAPHSPPEPEERVGPVGPEVTLLPISVKAASWTLGLLETVVALASCYPSNPWAAYAIAVFVHPLAGAHSSGVRITWASLIAWACSITGALIRRSCYQALQELFTFELSLRKNHRLVTAGPYSVVRHPSYTGAALALFGALTWFVAPGSWMAECSGLDLNFHQGLVAVSWLSASFVAAIVVGSRLKQEDELLKEHFGEDWKQWAARVPYRLIPGIY